MISDSGDLQRVPDPERLRWQCRRGMLELDLMLEGFLERGYPALEDEQKRLFARMLEFEDQLLLDWLMGYVVPADDSLRQMLEKIQKSS